MKHGPATLKGVVVTQAESPRACIKARGVPGLFKITNERRVEPSALR